MTVVSPLYQRQGLLWISLHGDANVTLLLLSTIGDVGKAVLNTERKSVTTNGELLRLDCEITVHSIL